MQLTVTRWLNQEFIAISGEAMAGLPSDEAARALLERFEGELQRYGLTRDHVVRHRLWGRDRATWAGGRERFKFFSGKARAASSSYICPERFDSEAELAFDILAMRPPRPEAEKLLQEYDPPTTVLRYLVFDSVVVLSGNTWDQGQLANQLGVILPRIGQSLAHAGTSWRNVARMSCFLHRSERLDDLKGLLAEGLGSELPEGTEYAFVDGFSTPGKLVEIEVTAVR